jgi:cell division protein FtsL
LLCGDSVTKIANNYYRFYAGYRGVLPMDNISSSIKAYRAEDKIRDLKRELSQLRKINESHQKEVANLLYDKSRLIGRLRDAGVPLHK